MKLIARHTDYTLRALCYIACHRDRWVTVSELVRELKVPRPFLRKHLQVLSKEGILVSSKGRGGGFLLKSRPERIFLLDIIRILQGRWELSECLLKKKTCPNTKACLLRKKIKSIERYVTAQLKHIAVADLIKRGSNG